MSALKFWNSLLVMFLILLALSSFGSGEIRRLMPAEPLGHSVLSEPPIPKWVFENDTHFLPGMAIWLHSRNSEEGEAFALSIVFQWLRFEVLNRRDTLPDHDLDERYEKVWLILPIEDRMLAMLGEEANKLWQPVDIALPQEVSRLKQVFLARLLLELLKELDDELNRLGDPRPVRLIDIAPNLLIDPGTDPALVDDPLDRDLYIQALNTIESNLLHNALLASYQSIDDAARASVPVVLEKVYPLDHPAAVAQLRQIIDRLDFRPGIWLHTYIDSLEDPAAGAANLLSD